MSECGIIMYIEKGLFLAKELSENFTGYESKPYEEAMNWLENKMSEAAEKEVREMEKEREKYGKEL